MRNDCPAVVIKDAFGFFYDFLSHENAKDATPILVSFCSVQTHVKGISALVIETLLFLLRTQYIHSDDLVNLFTISIVNFVPQTWDEA